MFEVSCLTQYEQVFFVGEKFQNHTNQNHSIAAKTGIIKFYCEYKVSS